MRDFRDAKAMAKSLRQHLSDDAIEIGHSQALELIAKAFGLDDWNVLAAKIEAATTPAPTSGADKTLYCSFCKKSQHEVETLIAGPPPSAICNECVLLSTNVLEEPEIGRRLDADLADPATGEPWPRLMEFMRAKPDAQLQAYVITGERFLPQLRADVVAKRKPRSNYSLPAAERRLVILEAGMEAGRRALAERGG